MKLITTLTALLVVGGEVAARCPSTRVVSCSGSPWRSADGSCNNGRDPTLGMANTPFVRLLAPHYADGVHAPRRSVSGGALPSARTVVTTLMPDSDRPSGSYTQLLMSWAQLLSHDVARVQAQVPFPNTRCCGVGNATDTCDRIVVSSRDPFYGPHGVSCIGVDRSSSAPCNGAAHEQINAVTHYVDASFVYGTTSDVTRRLRELRGGRMRAQVIDGEEFLPNFESGDGRVAITPMLAATQTLLMREHNRVAGALSALRPDWPDERSFQEARRVVLAEWQLITYRDWLPHIIGADAVQQGSLLPSTRTFSRDYDDTVDPSTANDFTSAAFRSLHSMVSNEVWLGEGAEPFERRLLGRMEADVILGSTAFRRIVLGMVSQPSQTQDQFMGAEITHKLFQRGGRFGGDLISTDIQRGREHGLPGYNSYREHCNLTRASLWTHFRDTISARNIALLRRLYGHPDDVDLYVGGLLEEQESGLSAVTSPVFRCIIADQFRRWKRGDRLFFDLAGSGFTQGQLQQLGKQTMARLICDNVPTAERVPRDPFLRLRPLGNKMVECKDLPGMDFSDWKKTLPLNTLL